MESSNGDCPLPPHQQTRNLILFAACTALQYLAAPIGYVGITQASLCDQLDPSAAVANLPETAFLLMTFAPVILAWYAPYVSWLKRNLIMCYAAAAASLAAVAAILTSSVSNEVKIAAVIVQAAVAGITVPSAIAFLWELIGRGAAERRRGLALSLAFGVGPLFGVLGSLGSQLLLDGSIPGLEETPNNFAALYAAAVPCMALAAGLSAFFVIPLPAEEQVRQPFMEAVFGGLGDFLRNPILRTATIATILLYVGNTITANLNLYSEVVYGDAPRLHAGYQNAARFACKMATGLLLGWLLSRTHPKAGLIVTGVIFIASVYLAMVANADTYFLVFAIYGAGELVGVYAPNYILSASNPADMRRNLAFVTMMMAPAAPAGYLFGLIKDVAGSYHGPAVGFRLSFAACAAFMLAGLIVAAVKLPRRPHHGSGEASS